MDVFKKIVKEFWFPALLAVSWTIYSFSTHSGEWGLKTTINTFGPSFFLVSWATGQFFRIKKQTHVDKNLQSIEERLVSLIESLEEKTKDLASHITGGDSFCFFRFGYSNPTQEIGALVALHHGAHNVYDVNVRVLDLDCFEKVLASKQIGMIGQCETNIKIGDMTPNHGASVLAVPLTGKKLVRFNAFFSARNGDHTQIMRIAKSGDKWHYATKIRKNNVVVFEETQEGFPKETLSEDGDWKA